MTDQTEIGHNSARQRIKKFVFHKSYGILIGIGLAGVIGHWLQVALQIKPREDLVYLHYNIYFGVDLVGSWYQLFLMPLVSMLTFILNTLLAYRIAKREPVMPKIILSMTLLVEIILIFATFLILRQNS